MQAREPETSTGDSFVQNCEPFEQNSGLLNNFVISQTK